MTTEVALTANETQELGQCEVTIDRGLRTFVDVGNALLTIRDKRLYRVDYGTFENYCREKWGLARRTAHQYIEAARVIENVRHGAHSLPENERQARPLTRLEPEQQKEAWTQVVEENPDGKITGAKVQDVVKRLIEIPGTEDYPDEEEDERQGCPDCRHGTPDSTDPERYWCSLLQRTVYPWSYVWCDMRDWEPEEMPEQKRKEHTMRIMGSSESPEWYTPRNIIDLTLDLFGEIDLDPCSNNHGDPNVPARNHYTKEDDGLAQEWRGRVYMNPPYGDEISKWTKRLVQAYKSGETKEAIALLPGRIDTQWFKPMYEFLICAIEGRLQFVNSQYSAPFPSVVVYLGDRRQDFIDTFQGLGPIIERVG